MNLLQKIQYSQNWNIGFCEQTPEELLKDKALKPIQTSLQRPMVC